MLDASIIIPINYNL